MAIGKITERVDAITEITDERGLAAPPCPRSVKIELTARCNFNCSFCATGYKLRDKRDMDWDFYVKLLKELKADGVEEVGMFYLGESFILDWLPDAIKAAKDAGIEYVFLTSNGSLSTPDKVKACMEAGLGSLKFSLNYADEEQFCSIAQVKGSLFHTMVDNIKAARGIRDEGGYECGLYGSYIDYDGEQGERMAEMVAEFEPYLDEVYALPLYSQADLVSLDEKDRGWDIRGGNPGRAGCMRPPVPCWSLFTEARVSFDGHLSACCFDHDGRFRMGDLKEISFMEAWQSPDFQALRQAHLNRDVSNTVCRDCVSYA
ncbi:MAG: radical SAM protein [Rhodospirillales bacterium]|jgi:MoaA/NifB/PqqE/SkfB family radical SAM enzyme|nr:radical SAM protein [Rhodospirillales bacterium]MBT4038461.1 radical SAM protein [Rhodospirillales bacterium]MBT4627365.1 radical SAM protein [Rhodospirillales bacterium]MBT5350907.1 radical SAM protein [Rhodospirillales bacterium]MBT6110817.1 radical SAM protein [Rhodospirillales bacterium]